MLSRGHLRETAKRSWVMVIEPTLQLVAKDTLAEIGGVSRMWVLVQLTGGWFQQLGTGQGGVD